MSSRFKSLRGRATFLGQGVPQDYTTLDPAPHEGSIVYTTAGQMRYSDGTNWVLFDAAAATSQGTQGIQGVQGLQGDYGPGFTIIGSVADVDSGGDPQATLNTAFPTPTIGDGVIDEADDELWIYVGASTWVNIGSFRGVQGFTGNQGTQGWQGEIGEEGIQGSRGFRGQQGAQGIQGYKGIQGVQGNQGIQGTQGPQAYQGVQGIQGIQGNQGVQGVQGPQAYQGVQGIQGWYGIQGWQGADSGLVLTYNLLNDITEADPNLGGVIFNEASASTDDFTAVTQIWFDDEDNHGISAEGLYQAMDQASSTNKGYLKFTKRDFPSKYVIFSVQEITDATGYWEFDVTYVSGTAVKEDFTELTTPPSTYTSYPLVVAFDISGDRGFQGIQGPQGTQGFQGWQGTQGVQGYQSAQGTQGFQGDQGAQGVQGDQGVQGVQGPQAYQGVQGTQGIQGYRGFQGIQGDQGVQGPQGWYGFQGGFGTQGAQGYQGFQGVQGTHGEHGGLTFEWAFDSGVTTADPGTSNFRFDNVDPTQATRIILDDTPSDQYSNQIDEILDYLAGLPGTPKGHIVISHAGGDGDGPGGHHFVAYTFSNFTWDSVAKNWGYFDVTNIESTVTNWQTEVVDTHDEFAIINFIPGGPIGPQGAQGTQGIQGFQGTQGTQGVQGVQGPQAYQGVQGIQGFQGMQGFEGSREFTVTNNGSTDYVIDGVNDPDLHLLRGFTYVFDINAPGHPFEIRLSNGGAAYNTGVTNNGTQNGKLVFRVPFNAPDSLYYQCTVHGAMGGNITTSEVGPQGIQGSQGVQGPQGWYGFQGTQGIQGFQAAQGFQGDLGFQGVQGFPGQVGPQGAQGSYGFQGADGAQGSTGSFGGVTFDYTWTTNTATSDPGVGYAKINNSNGSSATLLLMDDRDDNFTDIQPYLRTINDSTSTIKGHVKITEKQTPANFQLYTISGVTEASGYFAIDVSYVSGSVGGTFANDEDITITFARTGDIGDSGAPGPAGIQGLQGTQGIQGFTGAGTQGPQGTQGVQGFQGDSGTLGAVGAQGPQGTQGVQGFQGDAGIIGGDGIQGYQGVQGYQGITGQGVQGYQGFAGLDGIGGTGIQGNQGTQGVQGAQAAQGTQGFQGDSGTGFQGTQGVQGFQGFDGDPGAQGFQGAPGDGNQGAQGFQGFTGDPGFQGFTGIQGGPGVGTQGFQGFDGYQGFQGFSGEGNQGVQGNQGFIGAGAIGNQGTQGYQGFQGTPGDAGTGGVQGYYGFQGADGVQGFTGGPGEGGGQGAQGFQGWYGFQGFDGGGGTQGLQGLQGTQGFQGDLGFQGFTGAGLQGLQGTQGFQGDLGFQGVQGTQGFGNEGGVGNLQNVHTTALQDTALFIAMFEGGAEQRPLLGTTGPNPGGESNFYYQSDVDTLYIENLELGGNLTVNGTTSTGSVTGITSDMNFPNDTYATFGTGAVMKLGYESGTGNFLFDATTAVQSFSIENQANGTAWFTFGLGSGGGNFTATGDVTTNSDIRLKENIETIQNALDKVEAMRGVYFHKKHDPDVRRIGLIAQEVEQIIPEAVIEDDSEDKIKSVSYGNLVGLLIEAVKELKKDLDKFKG